MLRHRARTKTLFIAYAGSAEEKGCDRSVAERIRSEPAVQRAVPLLQNRDGCLCDGSDRLCLLGEEDGKQRKGSAAADGPLVVYNAGSGGTDCDFSTAERPAQRSGFGRSTTGGRAGLHLVV